MTRLLPILAVVLLAAQVHSAAAQPKPNPKQAWTDPDAVDDADYPLQGEYIGRLDDDSSWVGLQVVAQGNGAFIAVEYVGGLPGSGWDRQGKTKLAGSAQNGQLRLVGPVHTFVVAKESAQVLDKDGKSLGKLEMVARRSPTLGKQPPAGATVVFDGKDVSQLTNARVTPDGLLMEGANIKSPPTDFTMHLEFRLPYMPFARGQGRSNSGVYIHSRYEVQILDSFGLDGAFNECAALYRYQPPDVNMCLPPLTWQTYDIEFTAPRFDKDGKKTKNGRLTVRHNGIAVHDDFEFVRATGAGQRVGEGSNPLPIKLQNHGNPVRFRNIWIVDGSAAKPKTVDSKTPESAAVQRTTFPPARSACPQPATGFGGYGGYNPRSVYMPVLRGRGSWNY